MIELLTYVDSEMRVRKNALAKPLGKRMGWKLNILHARNRKADSDRVSN